MDLGDGVRSFDVAATRDGRRVETTIARGTIQVSEVTRSGRTVRSARFMTGRVVAIVEYPASEGPASRPRTSLLPENQPTLEV